CVELMCWPVGKAERRYAGVTHIDMDGLTPERESQIKGCLREKGVAISALGYYPNLLDPDPERRAFFAGHLAKVVDAASRLGVGLVNTFVGRNKSLGLEENFAVFREVWPPIVRHAEGRGVRIGIENCPMLFSGDEWPGGNNMAVSPAVWRRMFEMIPSPSFGLNYDPSHLVWQRMDHIKPIREFKDRLFHVHIKDVRVYRDRLDDHGILAAPLAYHSPKLPGLGDINWDGFLSALTDVRYGGDVCIEVEDKAFEDTLEDRKRALMISKRVWRF
ncbi:MAG: sugar phosphate isomerase/epimerase, partial [Oscillospiraceae bacterium]|nr:sugar phosphate isomerase/epimerase [Oscillospiraceae bacterium]